jgi:hypothetical protein
LHLRDGDAPVVEEAHVNALDADSTLTPDVSVGLKCREREQSRSPPDEDQGLTPAPEAR